MRQTAIAGTAPEPLRGVRGVRYGGETLTRIDASERLRPLRDTIILEPEDVIYSRYIHVEQLTKPLRGVVLAVGPGTYPKKYDHPEKHKRTKTWDSTSFLPTEVKVGDKVELGGAEIDGYAFEQFWWGDKRCLWCTERDVAGVYSDELDQRPAPRPEAVQRRDVHRNPAGRWRNGHFRFGKVPQR